jgi:energy-coupling factor transporter ATP-binding protein EcfA2
MNQNYKLNHYYEIHVNHLLSTRLDSDISKDFFERVIFHGTAYNSLKTIVDSFYENTQSAFTLTGGYGTGKSTLAAILSGLLDSNDEVRGAAKKLVNDSELISRIDQVFKTSSDKPWLIIKAVGGVRSPVELFYKSILNALQDANLMDLFEGDLFFLPEQIDSDNQLIEWIDEVFRALDGKISGSLFILDEMGKLLDHIARNNGDLHLFQDLSERINRLSTKQCPFIFLGILHQAFADYARGMSHHIALEWTKIQGRYVDIAYRISLDESVALISKTIKAKDTQIPEVIATINNALVAKVTSSIKSRLTENNPRLNTYLQDALPLHPLTTVLLGIIAKSSFSQNERSIFSFLLSVEPFSFRKFLESAANLNATYTIVDLWDYLSQNLQHQILSSKEGHLWAIVEESLTLLSKNLSKRHDLSVDDGEMYSNVIKAIAMLNMFGKPLGIYPSSELIAFALPNQQIPNDCLNDLQNWGLITYWNRTKSYEVVETSELNIQQLLQEKLETLSNQQNYFEHINYKGNSVLAKRHYHEKGVMRWMDQYLVNDMAAFDRLINSNELSKTKAFAHFVLVADRVLNSTRLIELSKKHPRLVIAKLDKINELLSWSKEIFALNEIFRELPKLMMDKVAKKEYEQRLSYAYQQVDDLFRQSFESVAWYSDGVLLPGKSLSIIVSDLADRLYEACPKISNELVVRHDVSSSAAAGRKKLLENMLENGNKENFGIEKFPPEKAIYLSCIKQLGLHHFNADVGEWEFGFPTIEESNAGLNTNLERVSRLFERGYQVFTDIKSLVPLTELYKVWADAPFGIPQGLLPIFALALLLAKEKSLAFYDKDVTQEFKFISEIDEEYINKLVKRPHEIAVKYIKEPAEKNRFINLLADSIKYIFEKNIEATPLAVARFLVSYTAKQSSWAKFSKDTDYFDEKVQLLRGFLVKADDPYKLLFEDLYEALEVSTRKDELILADLSNLLGSFMAAKPNLLENFEGKLRKELGNITSEIIHEAHAVSKFAADWKMKKFAEHLSKCSKDSDQWLSNLITLLGQIPQKDWTDDSLKKAFEALPGYVQRFKQLSFFARNANKSEQGNNTKRSLAVIINTDQGLEEHSRDVIVDSKTEENLKTLQIELFKQFESYELSDDARAMVLYELLKEYLHPIGEEKA